MDSNQGERCVGGFVEADGVTVPLEFGPNEVKHADDGEKDWRADVQLMVRADSADAASARVWQQMLYPGQDRTDCGVVVTGFRIRMEPA